MSILYPKNYSLGLPDAHAFPKVQYAKIVEIIDAVNKIIAGTITLTDVELGNGSVSAPSLTFASDLDTGIYRIGANNLGVAAGGSKILDVASTGLGVTGSITGSTVALLGAGAVGAPAYSFSAQTDMGLYKVSATQLGAAVSGALVGGFNASGLFTGTIAEQVTGSGITLANNITRKVVLTALNSTGTLTAAMINKGGITSTSGSAVTATLDTVANIVSQTGATAGTFIDFVVDNTGGSNTVTVTVPSGIVVAKQTSNGDTAVDQLLTVAASATIGVGLFRLYFQSTSAAVLYRLN